VLVFVVKLLIVHNSNNLLITVVIYELQLLLY